MAIHVLTPHIAAQIAAGEVIERPASVIKELAENSLDAGATKISFEITGGGLETIRVSDDGWGIPPNDISKAFQRYATSKLSNVTDLERLSTLGFRGEALPSIAAVSRIVMVTRTPEDLGGTQLIVQDSSIEAITTVGAPVGTTISVEGLFRRVPARKKFLRSHQTESARIRQAVLNLALAYPNVAFSLSIEGKKTITTQGQGDLRETAGIVFDRNTVIQMLKVSTTEPDNTSVWGLISPPDVNRPSRRYISVFVNRRWVQNSLLLYAIEDAYKGLLMTGRHPIAVLHLFVDPATVDVNVHPTKAEVRFRDERQVFSSIQKAIRGTIIDHSPVPQIIPSLNNRPSYYSDTVATDASPHDLKPTFQHWDIDNTYANKSYLSNNEQTSIRHVAQSLVVIGQLESTYIIAEGADGMYLIDQHAAHERILFDEIKKTIAFPHGSHRTQGLLEPIVIELSAMQEETVLIHGDVLKKMGFLIEPFGERLYLLRGLPTPLAKKDPYTVITELLDLANADKTLSDWEERMIATIACHGAVRAGDTLAQLEMGTLINSLQQTFSPNTCPHGRPTILHLTRNQLEKHFGRT